MAPSVGDVDSDHELNVVDMVWIAKEWKAKPEDLSWNSFADIDNNDVVGLTDLVIIAQHYGQHYP